MIAMEYINEHQILYTNLISGQYDRKVLDINIKISILIPILIPISAIYSKNSLTIITDDYERF